MKPLRNTAVGIALFAVLALVCGAAIYMTVSNKSLGKERSYHATFYEVSGLRKNSDVQVAGVRVGRVTDLRLNDDDTVHVAFTLSPDVPVSTTSRAVIRYEDLLGRRYLEIRPGRKEGEPLGAGGIDADQTVAALDLDEVYNGFSPLFEGLQPAEVNQLAGSLVAVLQGQASTAEQLLGRIGSLTNTVADRDRLVGDLIDSLNSVLGTVDRRGQQTDRALRRLTSLVAGLTRDRRPLGEAIERIARATSKVAGFVSDVRPAVRADLAEVERLSRVINDDGQELADLLANTPGYEALIGRVGIYQSAFQFYLCGVQLRIATRAGGPAVTTPMVQSQETRCQR